MPDETLRLKTGTDRDKALLLHVLLEHHLQAHQLPYEVQSVYTKDESFVKVSGAWMAMTSFKKWDGALPADIQCRF